MPDAEKMQYVVGSPEWQARQLDMRRLGIARTVEAAYQRERREFAGTCTWLGMGVAGAAFAYGVSFGFRSGSGSGRQWMALGASWLVELKGVIFGILVIASMLRVVVSPFGFVASLIRWIGAIKDRRRAMYPADHPDLEAIGGSPKNRTADEFRTL
jgi:hypothetical protein